MQQTKRSFAFSFLVAICLVVALLSTTFQPSFAQVDVETPTQIDQPTEAPTGDFTEIPTEAPTETPEITATPEVTETPLPTEMLPTEETETPLPTEILPTEETETPTPTFTETPEATETAAPTATAAATASASHWNLSVDLQPGDQGDISAMSFSGLSLQVQNGKLIVEGDSPDRLSEFLFDDAASYFDFLGGADQLTLTLPAQTSEFTLNLETRITTGYSWVVLPGENYSQIGASTFQSRYEANGAPSIQTLKIQTRGTEAAIVKLIYKRSFGDVETIHANLSIQVGESTHSLDLVDPTPAQSFEGAEEANIGATISDSISSIDPSSLPTSLDWRTKGYVTPVKDQGSCGSCWAFSSVAIMESAILKSGGPSTNLSEQFLVSCNTKGFSCAGGGYDTHYWHYNTLGYNQTKIGAVLESDMPYTESNGSCFTVANHPYKLSGWSFVTSGNATYPTTDQLKAALYTYGPIKVSICAGPKFQAYTGGVFSGTDNSCGGGTNHAVVLVGWNDSTSSWILRNSWGPSWGENGYMRIKYGTSVVGRNASWVSYTPVPVAPKPANPAGYILDTTPTFTWSAVKYASTYTLSVFDVTSAKTAFTATVKSSSCSSTTCTYTRTTALPKNHTYKWHVLATNSSGASSPYSSIVGFGLVVPPVPTLSSPSGITIDTTPTFTWYVSKTAVSYTLVLADNTTGATILTKTIKSSSCGTSSCSFTYTTALAVNKTYKWKVLATNALGNSAYSSYKTFIVSKPAVPVLVSPKNITGNSKPTFTWTATQSATSYVVTLINSSTSAALFTQTVSSTACTGSTCNYTTTIALTANQTYQWKVMAVNAIGSSAYSTPASFTFRIPDVPLSSAPSGEIFTNQPTFSWSAVEGAKSYTLKVYDAGSAADVYSTVVSTSNCSLSTCTITPGTALSVGTTYEWSVRANNDAGSSDYTSALSFYLTAPGVPTLTSPKTVAGSLTPVFTWTPVDNATSYTVVLTLKTSGAQVFSTSVDSTKCSTTTCTLNSPTSLTLGTYYLWQVKANNAAGSSEYAMALSFKPSAPFSPVFLSPSGTIYDQTPLFSWKIPEGVGYYKLEIYDNAGGYYVKANLSITPTCNDTTCTWGNSYWVEKNHSIRWTVTAVNGLGETAATELFIVK